MALIKYGQRGFFFFFFSKLLTIKEKIKNRKKEIGIFFDLLPPRLPLPLPPVPVLVQGPHR